MLWYDDPLPRISTPSSPQEFSLNGSPRSKAAADPVRSARRGISTVYQLLKHKHHRHEHAVVPTALIISTRPLPRVQRALWQDPDRHARHICTGMSLREAAAVVYQLWVGAAGEG